MKQITRTEWAWLLLWPFSILGAVLVALHGFGITVVKLVGFEGEKCEVRVEN